MNYLFDYLTHNMGYKMQNINNIYNFIYDIIKMENNDEYKKNVIKHIKKNIGIKFYNDFIAYCIKKNLDIDF
jgi:hypothetical protein